MNGCVQFTQFADKMSDELEHKYDVKLAFCDKKQKAAIVDTDQTNINMSRTKNNSKVSDLSGSNLYMLPL